MAGIRNVSRFSSQLSRFNKRLLNGYQETGRKINQELEKGIFKIRDRARSFVPVDDGDMTEAIKVDIERAPFKRNVYSVYVDETHVAVKEDSMVGEYLTWLHENRSYELGHKSQEKASRLGVNVGPKFMDRAYRGQKEEITARVRSVLKGAF